MKVHNFEDNYVIEVNSDYHLVFTKTPRGQACAIRVLKAIIIEYIKSGVDVDELDYAITYIQLERAGINPNTTH